MTEKRLVVAILILVLIFVGMLALVLVAMGQAGILQRPEIRQVVRQTVRPDPYKHPDPPIIAEAGFARPYPPTTQTLEEFFEAFPYQVSIFYQNLDTGFTFTHRDDVIYTSASLNKASHALYVYHLAEMGLTELSRTHIFRQGERRSGTGVIRHGTPYGTRFSHLELLMYSVLYSDNTAFDILRLAYRYYSPSYYRFNHQQGRDARLFTNDRTHRVTAADMGVLMQAIHQYFESDTELARHFRHSMLNSDVPIIVADYPVAQKYGHWGDGNINAFHDMAIVYAPSPYILIILSDMNDMAPFHAFEEISMFIQNFNAKYFEEGTP
ncbi:MAG: class A beta-lactamase-related serine hydrolase [Defluviitaleaceae bacterium]|nr:class A beta-lactamase-related serine hydrolase [Defluviitaleaceae bacterium]